MDVPKAPKLLGQLVGLGIAESAVPAGKLADLYGKVEDTDTRRQGVAEALLYVKASPPSLSLPGCLCTRPKARPSARADSSGIASHAPVPLQTSPLQQFSLVPL